MTIQYRKYIALTLIVVFILQIDGIIFSQSQDEIVRRFYSAVNSYTSGLLEDASGRLERLIDIIESKQVDRKDILGQSYLLLGAICEEQSRETEAETFYLKAKDLGIIKVSDVPLDKFKLYRKIVLGEKPPEIKVINGPVTTPPHKKKFPWLWVVGGVVVITTVILFLTKKKQYTLTVETDIGVNGTPAAGMYKYKKGERVEYSYSLKDSYSNLSVYLDGNKVENSGTIVMDSPHTLRVGSATNFSVSPTVVDISEGGTSTFHVKLSAKPSTSVNATISRTDLQNCNISVESGASLSFTPDNWDTEQTVTLKSDNDNDNDKNGLAKFSISASNMTPVEITANEIDKDLFVIEIIDPKNGQKVNGLVIFTVVKKSGLYPVKSIDFLIDEEKMESKQTEPFEFTWNATPFKLGPYKITVIGTDTANNKYTHSITVRNGY